MYAEVMVPEIKIWGAFPVAILNLNATSFVVHEVGSTLQVNLHKSNTFSPSKHNLSSQCGILDIFPR